MIPQRVKTTVLFKRQVKMFSLLGVCDSPIWAITVSFSFDRSSTPQNHDNYDNLLTQRNAARRLFLYSPFRLLLFRP